MRFFIDTYLQLTGQGDYTKEQVEFILNRDIIINESEAITNCKNSAGIISEQTIVANHPFVQDVDAELTRIKEEQQEAIDEYGQFGQKQQAVNADEE